MKKLMKLMTIPLLLTSLSASDIKLYDLGLNLGKSYTKHEQKDTTGSITLGNEPDDNFNSYEVYTNIDNILPLTLKTYLSYTYSNNDELIHQYLLVGVNKYYNLNSVSLYSTLLLGYGELKYKYNPLNSSKDNDVTATSAIVGLQIGMDYPISNNYYLRLNSKYLLHDYKTKLNPTNTAMSEINHKDTFNISVGFGYRF